MYIIHMYYDSSHFIHLTPFLFDNVHSLIHIHLIMLLEYASNVLQGSSVSSVYMLFEFINKEDQIKSNQTRIRLIECIHFDQSWPFLKESL